MLQKKRLTITLAILIGLFILYAAAAFWAGIKARKTLDEQYRMLASVPLFKVKSHHYSRGWFSSKETTELVFNRRLTGPYESMLPDNLRSLLGTTISFTNIIEHGPLPGIGHFDFRPGSAIVTTQFQMSDSTRRTLALFFGDNEPITVQNHLGFAGGGTLKVTIPAFDYEEALSGVKVKWQGFNLTVDYGNGFKQYQTRADSPSFSLEAATKGMMHFDGVHYTSDIRTGSTGVKLGASALSVDNVSLNWKDSIPYHIKLNELVYLLTRVHVGEFINPAGEFKPSSVTLKKLHYQIVTSEDDPFINSRGQLVFDSFGYNNQIYGPMRLDISADHLHGPTLLRLDQAISQMPIEGIDPVALRKAYIGTIEKYGMPLLENDPRIMINDFYLQMPEGEIKLKGELSLKGFKQTDLKDPLQVLKRVNIAAQLSLPQQTLDTLVVAQARNLFTVDQSAEDQPNLNEIDDLARNLLNSQLAEWANQGFIHMANGQIDANFNFSKGSLSISNKQVPLPWNGQDEASAAQHETTH